MDEHAEFDYGLFQQYLQGIAGGNRSQETAAAITHDVQLFFDSLSHSSSMQSTSIEFLFNPKNLENFYHFVKRQQHKPTIASEKLRRVKMAIQFILHETSDSKEDMNLYVKGMHLVTLLTQWTKSLPKAIAIQRQKHGIIMSESYHHS